MEGGREGPGLKGDMANTMQSDGVGETLGEEEAYCERSEAPSPAHSSEEGPPSPSTRLELRGLGGARSEMATGWGELMAMAPTG